MKSLMMLIGGTVVAAFIATTTEVGYADTAEVLPKGNFYFNVDYKHYIPWTKRYDRDGNSQDAAADFNGVMNATIFPSLKIFAGAPFNIANPNIGTTVTTFKYTYDRVEPQLAYGITDRLSFGVKIPYIWYKNDVNALLDSTNANIGLNPVFNPANPAGATNLPLIPVAMGGRKMTSEDMLKLLGPGLPGLPGYGFTRFQTWEHEGLGDIEAGLKYQYYKSDMWRLAAGVGVLFPTGDQEDINNLTDQNLGGGSYAGLFRLYNDCFPTKNLVLNTTLYYTYTFSQNRVRRVSGPHEPLTRDIRNVTIDPGDAFEVEASAKYDFSDTPWLQGTSLELTYHYTDVFNSDAPTAPILERETRYEEQTFIAKLNYSTIPLFMKKEFPVPMNFYVGYRNKFAGNNNAFKTQYIQTGLSIYF